MTSLPLSPQTRDRLAEPKPSPRETYDERLNRLLDLVPTGDDEGPAPTLARLARARGLTARTVRRRRDALMARGLLRVLPGFNTSLEPGLVLFSGQIVGPDRRALQGIGAPGLVVMQCIHTPPAVWVFGHATSFAQVQELEAGLREDPSVVSAELVPARGGAFARRRLRAWLHQELDRWAGVPSGDD